MSSNGIGDRDTITLAAATETIGAGHVLHLRAERLAGRRAPRRDAMPAADFTVGPDARGGFLVVDYARRPNGAGERFATAEEATREARKLLGWDRLGVLRAALSRVNGAPVATSSRCDEDARTVARGAALSAAFGHRRPLPAPLSGGCGVKAG